MAHSLAHLLAQGFVFRMGRMGRTGLHCSTFCKYHCNAALVLACLSPAVLEAQSPTPATVSATGFPLAFPLALPSSIPSSLPQGQASSTHTAPPSAPWPNLPAPPDARAFFIMPPAHINGQLTHTQGYFSSQAPKALAAWYQQTNPGRWVSNKVGEQTVLGQWTAPHFTTVQIQASGSGSKVIVASAQHSAAVRQNMRPTQTEQLLQELPSHTRMLHELITSDPGQSASYFVLDTPAGTRTSMDSVSRWLRAQGYRLQVQSQDPQGAHLLQFTGDKREAVVMVGKRADHTSFILINELKRAP